MEDNMLGSIPLTPKRLSEYTTIETSERLQDIKDLAASLANRRILHLSSLFPGPQSPDIITGIGALLSDLGIPCEWHVAIPSGDALRVNQALYEATGGRMEEWSEEIATKWLEFNEAVAREFNGSKDCIVVHDPQLTPTLFFLQRLDGRQPARNWIWHCNIDMRETPPDIADAIRPYAALYDAAIFPQDNCVPEYFGLERVFCLKEAIDPIGPRNLELSAHAMVPILEELGLVVGRPILSQIAPLDWWNDPLGTIKAYKIAKNDVPELQLALVGPVSAARLHPEFENYFRRVVEHANSDPDIHILSNLEKIGNTEINVIQSASQIVLQRSIRKGSSSMILEALWKEKPVIAGRIGEIPYLIQDEMHGFLIDNEDQMAARIVELVKSPERAREMGQRGHDHVRENFLITRYLKDYLAILNEVLG